MSPFESTPLLARRTGPLGLAVVLFCGAFSCGALLGCGSRSGLLGGSADSARSGQTGGAGGAGGEGGGDTGGPPPVCHLSIAKPSSIPLLSFSEGDADAPQLVVLDPGGAEGSHPALLATMAISEDANFWHPELRIAGIAIDSKWPEGATIDHAPKLAGIDAHGYGRIAPGVGGGLGLLWFRSDEAAGKPTGVKFRPFDTSSWAGGPEVFVDHDGYSAQAIHPGKADGTEAGADGYVAAFSSMAAVSAIEPRVAVLDATGAVTMGPLAVAGPDTYARASADAIWTGQTHLVAVGSTECPDVGPPCKDNSMLVLRIVPPSGGNAASVELVSHVEVVSLGAEVRRPSFARVGDALWLAWSEKGPGEEDAPRRMRIVQLAPDGSLAGDPITLAEEVPLAASLSVTSTPHEMLVAWGEVQDPYLSPEAIGRSRIVLHHLDAAGAPIDPPLSVDTTGFAASPSISMAGIDHPWGFAMTWGAVSEGGTLSITWLSRLDCTAAD